MPPRDHFIEGSVRVPACWLQGDGLGRKPDVQPDEPLCWNRRSLREGIQEAGLVATRAAFLFYFRCVLFCAVLLTSPLWFPFCFVLFCFVFIFLFSPAVCMEAVPSSQGSMQTSSGVAGHPASLGDKQPGVHASLSCGGVHPSRAAELLKGPAPVHKLNAMGSGDWLARRCRGRAEAEVEERLWVERARRI
ncbi:hypothetical protein BO78DRAFT_173595 [Aspergillus sclerotiicarbonarius CBS 121057]|uniref:Uncharacterized protein n=1 Tax=Aspergillus sclerotiicarbonarius (strain CBS 121057 / IBT 28362) TaxID=1448318 RepID=A0A319E4Q2_ASPSB|nr:hypothetical protein BO78DRAFT_173595 [Aspergillus sclerotiicarbonarius CBS 121057]